MILEKRKLLLHLAWAIYFSVYISFLILTTLSSFHTFEDIFRINLRDLGIYLEALENSIRGTNPYLNTGIGSAFIYPPQSLLLFEPIRLIKSPIAQIYSQNLLGLLLLGFIVHGTASKYNLKFRQVWFWYLIAFLSAPLAENLIMRQTNLFIAAGIFGLYYWEASLPLVAAISLSVASIIKVTPLIFIGYLVVMRRYKIVSLTFITLLVITGFTILRYGVLPLKAYPDVFTHLLNIFDPTANGQSLFSKLSVINNPEYHRLLIVFPSFLRPVVNSFFSWTSKNIAPIKNILFVYFVIVIGLSSLATLLNRKREPLFIISYLFIILLPNIVWYHHYVYFITPLFLWMGWKQLKPFVTIWCLIGFLVIQIDRWYLTFGLLIHIFGHFTIIWILIEQLIDGTINFTRQNPYQIYHDLH